MMCGWLIMHSGSKHLPLSSRSFSEGSMFDHKNVSRCANIAVKTLFPAYCCCCEREGVWVCENCERHFEQGTTFDIEEEFTVISSFRFRQKGIQEIIHAFKYEGLRELALWCGSRMAATWEIRGKATFDLLVPVPLHTKRLRERGYNQAELLALEVSHRIRMPLCLDAIGRVRMTEMQFGLSGEERAENVKGCFTVRSDVDLKGKRILLIDDVCTTGATLKESALALRLAGAVRISALVVAHG